MPDLPQIGPPGGLEIPGTFQVPQENPAVQALRESAARTDEAVTNAVMGIRHLQVLRQSTQADADFVNGLSDIEASTYADTAKMAKYYSMQDPVAAGKAFLNDVNGQIGQLKQKILASNKGIAPELEPQLNIRSNDGLMRLRNRFVATYDQNQRDAFTSTALQSSAEAALGQGGVDENGDPVNPQVGHTMANYLNSLKAAPGILPNEKADTAIRYHQLVATMSLEQRAAANPEDVLAMKAAPTGVLPQEFERIQNEALVKLTFGWRQTEAAVKQDQDTNNRKILAAEASGNHQLAVALSNKFMPFHRMTNDIYRVVNGTPYEEASDPAYKKFIEDNLAGMTRENQDEVEHNLLLGKEGQNPSLNKRDFAFYTAQLNQKKADLTNDFKAAEKTMRATVVNAVDDINKDEYKDDKIDRAGTIADWDAAVARAKTPADLLEARNQMLEKIQQTKLSQISAGSKADAVARMKSEMDAWLHRYEAVGLPPVPLRTSIYKAPGLGNPKTALPPLMPGTPVGPNDFEGLADTIRGLENRPGEAWRETPVSSKGAIGPYQITKPTAEYYGIPMDDLMDENKERAAVVTKILPDLAQRFHGNKILMLAAYNAGPNRVLRAAGDLTKLPQETRDYVLKGMGAG